MPYWLAKFLGRADGPALTLCVMCRTHMTREDGIRVTGTTGLACSDACAEEALQTYAY